MLLWQSKNLDSFTFFDNREKAWMAIHIKNNTPLKRLFQIEIQDCNTLNTLRHNSTMYGGPIIFFREMSENNVPMEVEEAGIDEYMRDF